MTEGRTVTRHPLSLKRSLARLPLIRPMALRILSLVGDRDIRVRHALTGDPLVLHLFRHRGYWFHGRTREAREIRLAGQLLTEGRAIIDIGANVGFLSLVYRNLASNSPVIAVEPSASNRAYLTHNVSKRGVDILPFAVGAEPGTATLFEDVLTGQNSSLLKDFKVLAANARRAGMTPDVEEHVVEVVTLGTIGEIASAPVGFVKIDVEGFEYEVLVGGEDFIASQRPNLQIEVQRHGAEVLRLLGEQHYRVFSSESRAALEDAGQPVVIFAVPANASNLKRFQLAAVREGYHPVV
jgi:FkbM family methyltransferase